jgi:hypothetical protein
MTARAAIRLLFVIAQLSIPGENVARAQSAEPLRIEFRSGSHVARVKGSLQGRQQMEYVTELRKDQRVTLALASGSTDEVKVRLRDPRNMDIDLFNAGTLRWTATVAESGDYEIWVVRVNNTPGKSSYTLRITLQ